MPEPKRDLTIRDAVVGTAQASVAGVNMALSSVGNVRLKSIAIVVGSIFVAVTLGIAGFTLFSMKRKQARCIYNWTHMTTACRFDVQCSYLERYAEDVCAFKAKQDSAKGSMWGASDYDYCVNDDDLQTLLREAACPLPTISQAWRADNSLELPWVIGK